MASWTRSLNSLSSRVVVVAVLSLGVLAQAQPRKKVETDEQKARVLFAEGQKAYDVGEFERALTLYSDAYKLKTLPGFLFNIAQCHRQLGNFERASFFFGRFIDNSKPEAPNVELARELSSDMERRQREKNETDTREAAEKARAEAEAKAKADAPIAPQLTPVEVVSLPPAPPVVEPEPVTAKAWFWVVIGGAVVAVAGGITAGVLLSQPREVMYVPRMTSLPDIDGRR
jgi:tetratricopeptide (TPR) repeat protein